MDRTTSCFSFIESAFGKATAVQGQYLFQLSGIFIVVLLAFSMFCIDEPKVQGQRLFPGYGYHSDADPVPASSLYESPLGLSPSNARLKLGKKKCFGQKNYRHTY